MGMRNIYSWVPKTKHLELMEQSGLGTVRKMEFDNYGSNLYWIDPVAQVIRVMNADSRKKINIIQGNSTYEPIDFALISRQG